jgi:hypothetical protein
MFDEPGDRLCMVAAIGRAEFESALKLVLVHRQPPETGDMALSNTKEDILR